MCLKNKIFFLSFFFTFTSFPLWAVQVFYQNTQCLSVSSKKVYQAVTNYSIYKQLDDYNLKKLPYGFSVRLVNMIHSKIIGTQRYLKPKPYQDDWIFIQLQPMGIPNGALYPRFMIQCRAIWENQKHTTFEHMCQFVNPRSFLKNPPKGVRLSFAVKNFKTFLKVTSVSRSKIKNSQPRDLAHVCKAKLKAHPSTQNFSVLRYKLFIESITKDVQEIKKASVEFFAEKITQKMKQFPAIKTFIKKLMTIIVALFDERTFFRNYYIGFYKAWSAYAETAEIQEKNFYPGNTK